MKTKKIIILSTVLAVIAVIAIKTTFFPAPFYYAGTVEATKVDLSSRLGSVLGTLAVREGDPLQKDQVLATLDCDDLKIGAAQANKDFLRAQRLYAQGSMPLENYEHSKLKYDDLKLRLDWCEIKSPIRGKVLTRYQEPGEFVLPGTKIFTIADLENLWAYIYVAAPLLAKLQLGQKIFAYLPEMKMQAFDATITKISDEAEFTPKNVQTREERTRLVYAIKIQLVNTANILKPGMTVEVKFPE
jgi:HlyD family secretion protein